MAVRHVPEQFIDERDGARFRHLAQLPAWSYPSPHISRYAFEPHTHEAFGIGTIKTGAERFRYRGSHYLAPEISESPSNPDEIHWRVRDRWRLATCWYGLS